MKRLLLILILTLSFQSWTKADDNKDKKITNGELIAYLKDNVSQEAFTQNRHQDLILADDPDKVLLRY